MHSGTLHNLWKIPVDSSEGISVLPADKGDSMLFCLQNLYHAIMEIPLSPYHVGDGLSRFLLVGSSFLIYSLHQI